jgi:hypothetical protein
MPRRNGVNRDDIRRFRGRGKGFKQALQKELRKALVNQKNAWFGAMADQFRAPLTPYGQPNPHRRLHNRTNALRNSLKGRVVGNSLKKMGIVYSSASPYVGVQEFGAVVRPKRAKMLAIPIDDNLKPAGGRKRPSPRDFPDGFFIKLKSGNVYFVRQTEKDLEFLFAMRRKVTIPGPRTGRESRLKFVENAIGKTARKDLRRRLIEATDRTVKQFFGAPGRLAGPRGPLPG